MPTDSVCASWRRRRGAPPIQFERLEVRDYFPIGHAGLLSLTQGREVLCSSGAKRMKVPLLLRAIAIRVLLLLLFGSCLEEKGEHLPETSLKGTLLRNPD